MVFMFQELPPLLIKEFYSFMIQALSVLELINKIFKPKPTPLQAIKKLLQLPVSMLISEVIHKSQQHAIVKSPTLIFYTKMILAVLPQ